MKIKNIKYIILIIFLYIYLYNPIFQILDFGLIKILLFISILYLIISKKGYLFITLFKNEIIFSLILIIYSSLIVFWGDGTAFKVPYTHLVWFLECFVIPFFLMFFFREIFQKRSWEYIIVNAGLIASLITLFLILNPEINFFIRDTVIRDIPINISDPKTLNRGFTIAENSTYGYGIIQGLILVICLFSMKKNYLYALPIVFLFVSILFNSRIGLVCVIIGILLMLLKRRIKILNLSIFGAVLIVGYILFFKSNFSKNYLESLQWGFDFFKDTFNYITGNEQYISNYSILEKMIFFPSKIINIIFGEGRIVFYESRHSDIGYINEIFVGGIVYLFMLLSFLLYMFLRNFKITTNRQLTILFFLTLMAVNIKGIALFVPSGFFRLVTFYYVYCILLKRTEDFRLLNIDNKKD